MIKLRSILTEIKKDWNINNIDFNVSVHKADTKAQGVSEKDLPNMENWPLKTRDNHDNVVIVTAVFKGKLIGKAMFGYWGTYAGLTGDSVYVMPSYRKLGIANKMYDEAEKFIGGKIMPS